MSDNMDLTCEVCFEAFLAASSASEDRRPRIFCKNGHSFCSDCCSKCTSCPTCRGPKLADTIINFALLKFVETSNESLINIPEIPKSEVTFVNQNAIAMGSYSEVFLCKWNNQKVAVKRLRINPKSDQMKSLKLETSLAISFFHPNVVRIYGQLKMDNGFLGIVMEWADQGSLADKLRTLSFDQKVKTALGICDGLSYLHSKKVAHRDLKPDNVLLFGTDPLAKISDFGTSKVIQTMITNTSMAGTPKYSAPELMETGVKCGKTADIFSLAIILYELFSGLDPFPGCQTIMQVVSAMIRDQRPDFPASFPSQLREVIKKGWSKVPEARPDIKLFRIELKKYEKRPSIDISLSNTMTTTIFSLVEQIQEISLTSMPVTLISMKWDDNCDYDGSSSLRNVMVENVRTKCNFRTMIAPSILKAMEVVPRHIFMEPSRVSGSSTKEKIESVYVYNKAMGATTWSNESSPEIISVQLSLVKLNTGMNVLIVGGKGGYINSLVAQVIGISGRIVTISSNNSILNVCKERVNSKSPLARIMEWKQVENVIDPNPILNAHQSGKEKFDAIIYCGAIPELPMSMGKLLNHGGSLIAPVQVQNNQQFQLLMLQESGEREIRKISDFGVIFEKAQ